MKKLQYGLIANRHSMPVSNFIFNEIKDVVKIRNIENKAYRKMKEIVNENKGENYLAIDLYVTGLTVALVSVIKACQKLHKESNINIKLILKHHNHKTKNYHNQSILFYFDEKEKKKIFKQYLQEQIKKIDAID
ncbi:hypothetical protein [uncultured Brachyspira sp.]|uniref:hypothetical protein n=1 Tax=uncultured Brachyspira sp. TaxID=221953 RepID=UPI0025875CFE|nr:hypothetical protein [uncultured Brachyspira sp.]